MSRSNTASRSRSGSTSNPGSGSRRNAESSLSVPGPRTMASQEDQDTQLDFNWAFVNPPSPHDHPSLAITLYYPARKTFSKATFVTFRKCYKDAETRILVIEVNLI